MKKLANVNLKTRTAGTGDIKIYTMDISDLQALNWYFSLTVPDQKFEEFIIILKEKSALTFDDGCKVWDKTGIGFTVNGLFLAEFAKEL